MFIRILTCFCGIIILCRGSGYRDILRLPCFSGIFSQTPPMTSPITRISISVEEELLNQFDLYSVEQGYPTRSEAIKNVIRDVLVLQQWEKGDDVAGAVSVVYDHHKPGIVQKILTVQHDWSDVILCSQHVHLDHDNCMEIIAVRGRGERIKTFLARLRAIKGLKHTVLTMSTAGDKGGNEAK